jgi:hypothetical protein
LETTQRYLVYLSGLEGKRVEVCVRKQRSQRSLKQNAAYWGIAIEILSNHLGYDENECHHAMKIKFASRVDEKTGLTIIQSTAKMDTQQFIKYYEAIQRWAIEFLNVYIPDPNECDPGQVEYQ